MKDAPEPPEGLPNAMPVPMKSEDLNDLLDVLLDSIRGWDYSSDPVENDREIERLARLGDALAVVARAYNETQQPLLQAHRENRQAADTWSMQRWFQRSGPKRPNESGARLAIETLCWHGVLTHLAQDDELAATFQALIARFLALRSSGQEPAGEQRP